MLPARLSGPLLRCQSINASAAWGWARCGQWRRMFGNQRQGIEMAEDRPSLSIDTDWKKQAQEEKRRLAEEAKKREEQAAEGIAGRIGPAGAAPAGDAAPASGRAQPRELPPASFATLVQS